MKYDATELPVLIIGYGNELRGDDGAGRVAACRVARQLRTGSTSVITVHQLLPELAEPVSRSNLAIFIDADCQLSPGFVCKRSLTASQNAGGTIGHQQDPEGILRLAQDLFGRAPRALLFSIGGADFGFRHSLSPQVRRAMPDLVRDVVDAVNRALREVECCNA